MNRVRIIAVGKIKQSAKYLEAGIALYEKRLAHYTKLEWVEVAEENPTPTRTVEQILEKEADAILRHCDPDSRVILLSERGKEFTSPEWSANLFGANPPDRGRGSSAPERMILIIGGAYGTSQRLAAQAHDQLALSRMTFPHQMVRLIVMEQLYRAFTIRNNEPYHKV